ncbi:MAG: tryptophanase [bacterium]|jgi:tryptophanase
MPIEPYRIKATEPVRLLTRSRRLAAINRADFNPFNLRSEDIYVDLLTDSGTGSMTDRQWAALLRGDESYAGSRSFYAFKETVSDLFGFDYVLPAHQGRSAELVVMTHFIKKGMVSPGNIHFDTTTAHIEFQGGIAKSFVVSNAMDIDDLSPFKGNIDTGRLGAFLSKNSANTGLVVLTLTCNSGGGQPVSLANIREVSKTVRKFGVPLFFDAARITENAYFIKTREYGYAGKSIRSILRECCKYADGMWMSAKKDGLGNIGGFIAVRDPALYDELKQYTILFDGFVTYGGLAGRDLEALAVGLREATDIDYLRWRTGQVAALGAMLEDGGVRCMKPFGGHAIYIDASSFLPHIPPSKYPGQALAVYGYIEGGVRSCEIGPILRGRDPKTGKDRPGLDLVRLAIPRRVYTMNHLEHVAETFIKLRQKSSLLRGMKFTYEAPRLRHFSSKFGWAD